jgi:hypothetical protein
MKNLVIPVLFFCIALSSITTRLFQPKVRKAALHENCGEDFLQKSFSGSKIEPDGQFIDYEELSTKQINYLIL